MQRGQHRRRRSISGPAQPVDRVGGAHEPEVDEQRVQGARLPQELLDADRADERRDDEGQRHERRNDISPGKCPAIEHESATATPMAVARACRDGDAEALKKPST